MTTALNGLQYHFFDQQSKYNGTCNEEDEGASMVASSFHVAEADDTSG